MGATRSPTLPLNGEVAMVPVLSLWLPILLSSVLVFVASSAIHMFLGYHADDYGPLPDEEAVAGPMRASGLAPGQYVTPYAGGMEEMNSPEFAEKRQRGPVALITVMRSGPVNMGRQLGLWFLFILAVGIAVAYVTGRAVGPGGDYLSVFRFAATTSFVAYAFGSWSDAIWYGRPLKVTLKDTLDAVIYAGLTAGVFGWLWPG